MTDNGTVTLLDRGRHLDAPPSPGAARIDHLSVDWSRVRRASYLLQQQFTYEYPGPVQQLNQRLVVFPNEWHGGQRLLDARLDVTAERVEQRDELDAFGNRILRLSVSRIDRRIDFTAHIALERTAADSEPAVPAVLAHRYLADTSLTAADVALRQAASILADAAPRGESQEQFVARVNAWVYRAIRYDKNATSVQTRAAEAFALRAGVCQDYAHVMLALLRLLNIPARYVSGHLLGEGATHAWVEALLRAADRTPKVLVAHAFDPTHGRRAGLGYITIATGRDYLDVAPTSGTFTAPYSGTLHATKRAVITALEYNDEASAATAA